VMNEPGQRGRRHNPLISYDKEECSLAEDIKLMNEYGTDPIRAAKEDIRALHTNNFIDEIWHEGGAVRCASVRT
jgi:hypothetical protein